MDAPAGTGSDPSRPRTESTTRRTFEDAAADWVSILGRLRDTVRQQLVRHQLREVLGPGTTARVLDVGCGQGSQLLQLARDGHDVTGLDPSEQLLDVLHAAVGAEPDDVRSRVHTVVGSGERAAELIDGRFDLVLCHGVLMYVDDPAPMLAAMTAVSAPGARLSLLVRNGGALAMRDGLRGRWADAVAQLDRTTYTNRLGVPARAHTLDELDATLGPLGWQRETWYGVRVFTDHLDEPAPPDDELDRIVAAELEAGRRDPYRAVAALLHVVYAR